MSILAFMKHRFNYLLLCNKSPLSGLHQKQSFYYFPVFLWIGNLGRLSWTALAWIVVGQWPEQLGVDWQLCLHADSGPLLHVLSPWEVLRASSQYGIPRLQRQDSQCTRWKLYQLFWSCLHHPITSNPLYLLQVNHRPTQIPRERK